MINRKVTTDKTKSKAFGIGNSIILYRAKVDC